MKKIALVGSAPSSVRMAASLDSSWTIWACSPGAYPFMPRVDAWFELHLWEPHESWFHKDYVNFMASLSCPVYMLEPRPEIPRSVAFPKEAVLNHTYGVVTGPSGSRPAMFDPNAFGSSLSWMMALAITQEPEEIAFFGVDMAANEEYGPQKDGCLNLVHVARSLGIRVTAPPQSDLLRPHPLYGFREADPMFIKLQTRVRELTDQYNKAEADYQEADRRRWFFKGALDDCQYVQKTWVTDPTVAPKIYADPHPAALVKSQETVLGNKDTDNGNPQTPAQEIEEGHQGRSRPGRKTRVR